MRREVAAKWGAVALVGFALEADALKNKKHDHTLSYVTRAVFRTHCKSGKLTFLACLTSVAVWYGLHIVGKENPEWYLQ